MLQSAQFALAVSSLGVGAATAVASSKRLLKVEETGSAVVARDRLDDLVGSLYGEFDVDRIFAPVELAVSGAQSDVRLFRVVTQTILPRTGEEVDVTGLLALSVDAEKALPVVSWQHGSLLSYDQVPSNLIKLEDRNLVFYGAAYSAKTPSTTIVLLAGDARLLQPTTSAKDLYGGRAPRLTPLRSRLSRHA